MIKEILKHEYVKDKSKWRTIDQTAKFFLTHIKRSRNFIFETLVYFDWYVKHNIMLKHSA